MLAGSVGGFDTALSEHAAVADLAWRQAVAGRRAIVESREVVYAPAAWANPAYGVRAGYESERVFWRRRAARQYRPSLFRHLLFAAFLAFGGIVQPRRWLHLAGKVAAWTSIGRFRREGRLAFEAASALAASTNPPPKIRAPHMLNPPAGSRRNRDSSPST
jgi:hypothetical protein